MSIGVASGDRGIEREGGEGREEGDSVLIFDKTQSAG